MSEIRHFNHANIFTTFHIGNIDCELFVSWDDGISKFRKVPHGMKQSSSLSYKKLEK